MSRESVLCHVSSESDSLRTRCVHSFQRLLQYFLEPACSSPATGHDARLVCRVARPFFLGPSGASPLGGVGSRNDFARSAALILHLSRPGLAEAPGAPALAERKGLMCNRPAQAALSLLWSS